MNPKPSSLAGPLWVIGITLLILGAGVGFIGYVMWEKNPATNRQTVASPIPPEFWQGVTSNLSAAVTRPRLQIRSGSPAGSAAGASSASSEIAAESVGDDAGLASNRPRVTSRIVTGGGAASVAPRAGIFGHVTLRGTPPPEKPLPLDGSCASLSTSTMTTRFYEVGSRGELADVFVYIRSGLNVRNFQIPPGAPVLIDQIGCEYQPYVLGLQTGQTLAVRNSDRVIHNVHFTPAVPGNREVNKAQLAGAPDLTFVWQKAEIFVRLRCDVHPWMFSYIGVLDHPFFAVTDSSGSFHISAPPPGRYMVEALHRKTHGTAGKGVIREIEARQNEQLQLDFEIELPDLTASTR